MVRGVMARHCGTCTCTCMGWSEARLRSAQRTPMRSTLQPHAEYAATLCGVRCNPMRSTLQPYVAVPAHPRRLPWRPAGRPCRAAPGEYGRGRCERSKRAHSACSHAQCMAILRPTWRTRPASRPMLDGGARPASSPPPPPAAAAAASPAPALGLLASSLPAREASSSIITVSGFTCRSTRCTSSAESAEMCAVPTSVISCRAVCTTLTLESHSALGSARAGAAASAVDADAARRVESGAVARRPDSPPTAHLRLSSGELLGRAVLRGAAGCGARRQATAAGSSSSSSRVRDASRAVNMLALQLWRGRKHGTYAATLPLIQ